MDELFYIRAWNDCFVSYAGALAPRLHLGISALEVAAEAARGADPRLAAIRLGIAIRRFWMWTAHLAARLEYSRLIQQMSKIDLFAQHWQAIINETGQSAAAPMVLQPFPNEVEGAAYSMFSSEILFPPLYRVFVFGRADEGAIAVTQHLAVQGLPSVHFADRLHWAD